MRLQRADSSTGGGPDRHGGLFRIIQVSPIIPKLGRRSRRISALKISDGPHREYKFSAAKSQIRQVEAVGHQAESDILTRIDRALQRDGHLIRSSCLRSTHPAGSPRSTWRMKEAGVEGEGAAPSSDVVDARLNLAKIRIERLQAAYYYDMMARTPARSLRPKRALPRSGREAGRSHADPLRTRFFKTRF